MGFRDLRVFNLALLAKQVWRLLLNPDTLISRILKARYFNHTSILEARLGYRPSFTWRSLWSSKSLLLEGLRWRVGNGQSINVWKEPWLNGPQSTTTPKQGSCLNPDMRVSDLMIEEQGEWDENKLLSTFSAETVNHIKEIPLSIRNNPDALYWWPSKDGDYTVKSGYWLGMRDTSRERASENFWKAIWNLRAPPKLAHFIWRACSNALAVKANLFRRHIRLDETCDLCGAHRETVTQAIFRCNKISQVWNNSPFLVYIHGTNSSSFQEIVDRVRTSVNQENFLSFLTKAWVAWTHPTASISIRAPARLMKL